MCFQKAPLNFGQNPPLSFDRPVQHRRSVTKEAIAQDVHTIYLTERQKIMQWRLPLQLPDWLVDSLPPTTREEALKRLARNLRF